MAKLMYQGHGSFRVISNDNTVVYVDPYLGKGYDIVADGIVITHEHHDHTKISLVTLKNNAKIIRANNLTDGTTYRNDKINTINVIAVPAYNSNHKQEECMGVIIEVDGKKIYATGDTSTTDFMSTLSGQNIDYALFCCDGIYNMDVKEASECAKIVNAKINIPYHTYPEHLFSKEIAEKFTASNRKILLPGDEIVL